MSGTKICPNEACGKTLGRTARSCECGQIFGKAVAVAAKPKKQETKRKPKKRAKRKPKTARLPVATRKAAEAASDAFRVGIFDDGGLAIVNERGGLELNADQAVRLATFCRAQFAEVED